MPDANNDDRPYTGIVSPSLPDAHGEAALLLVESLIHGLLARSGLSVSQAIDVVQTAIDTQAEIDEERGSKPRSIHLLSAIVSSLQLDRREDGAG